MQKALVSTEFNSTKARRCLDDSKVVDGINVQHHNKVFLPGYHCPPLMSATNNLEHVITGAELVLSVIPTQFIERTLSEWCQRTQGTNLCLAPLHLAPRIAVQRRACVLLREACSQGSTPV